ncbi:hypothetical protein ACFX2G_044091 [Malus domestica]
MIVFVCIKNRCSRTHPSCVTQNHSQPDHVPSIISTIEVLMKLGSQSLPIARSFLMNVLRLKPTNHKAWLNLGLISKKEGSKQEAANFFQAAHELQLSAPVRSFV